MRPKCEGLPGLLIIFFQILDLQLSGPVLLVQVLHVWYSPLLKQKFTKKQDISDACNVQCIQVTSLGAQRIKIQFDSYKV